MSSDNVGLEFDAAITIQVGTLALPCPVLVFAIILLVSSRLSFSTSNSVCSSLPGFVQVVDAKKAVTMLAGDGDFRVRAFSTSIVWNGLHVLICVAVAVAYAVAGAKYVHNHPGEGPPFVVHHHWQQPPEPFIRCHHAQAQRGAGG
jgi:hypothetical protein